MWCRSFHVSVELIEHKFTLMIVARFIISLLRPSSECVRIDLFRNVQDCRIKVTDLVVEAGVIGVLNG